MISDSSNPSVKNAYPSFSYSIDTSSRTAHRSRRLFYALQQKSSLTHFVAPPSKNKTARPLRASSTTSALRCAGFCFVWGSFHAWRIRTARAPPKKTAPIGCCLFWCSEDDRIMSAHASSRVHETVRALSNALTGAADAIDHPLSPP